MCTTEKLLKGRERKLKALCHHSDYNYFQQNNNFQHIFDKCLEKVKNHFKPSIRSLQQKCSLCLQIVPFQDHKSKTSPCLRFFSCENKLTLSYGTCRTSYKVKMKIYTIIS